MGQSSGSNVQGVPIVDYARNASHPPISVERRPVEHTRASPPMQGTHAHDFLMLRYVERGNDVLRVADREWTLTAGDALVIAPGAVVAPPKHRKRDDREVWAVFFPADAVDPAAAAPLASWRTHPLLSPFIGNHRGGAQRLQIPPDARATWLTNLAALETELRTRRDGYADAARAHLTLLLVTLGRLPLDVPAELDTEPLLTAVFDFVETHYQEPISLRDVADAVGLTTGHLTTVIGQRTGRTVQQWITERRMREARRLLAGTELTATEIAHRVGYRDAGYFVRRFRVAHGVAPMAWRRAGQ
jgi:AraC-like DNA-binding protein